MSNNAGHEERDQKLRSATSGSSTPQIVRPSKNDQQAVHNAPREAGALSQPPTLTAALSYLKTGWRPIPIVPGGKDPLLTSWKDYQARSPTQTEVTQWFTKWPDANVAVVTGQGSGIVVVDIDSQEGEDALRSLCGDVRTLTSLTSRGRHLPFPHPGNAVRNALKILPGIDVKGDGGYILVQPSIHPSGKPYQWAVGCEEWLH